MPAKPVHWLLRAEARGSSAARPVFLGEPAKRVRRLAGAEPLFASGSKVGTAERGPPERKS
jgi:hypothetical protein